MHLEGDPDQSIVRINQLKTILNYFQYLDKNIKYDKHLLVSGDWNDENPIYPGSVMNHTVNKLGLYFYPYFYNLVNIHNYSPIPDRRVATSYQMNVFDFENAKMYHKEAVRTKQEFDHRHFYSLNQDPWKIIDHLVISRNSEVEYAHLYPSNPHGVLGLSPPYMNLEPAVLSNWCSDHAALWFNIRLV